MFVFFGLVLAMQASAQTSPYVTSFTASSMSLQNAYTTVLSWNIAGGNGSNLYFYCPTGVSVHDENGSSVACNTAVNTGNYASGSAAYTFFNVGGSAVSFPVRLVPRNDNGSENSSGSANITLSVSSAPQLITDFSASTLYPNPGDTVTFSWTGVYIGGVNFWLSCADAVTYATKDSSASYKCGTIALENDLPATGSFEMKIANTSFLGVPIRVTVMPSQGEGMYNGIKGVSLDLLVGGYVPPASPSLDSFTSGKPVVYSGEPFDVSWTTSHAKGLNVQFQCDASRIVVSAVVGTTTTALACNAPAFSPALDTAGTATISIAHKEPSSSYTEVSLVPLLQRDDGTYLPIASKTFKVKAFAAAAPVSAFPSASVLPTGLQTQNPPTATLVSSNKILFTLPLELGSKGAQVTALQEFLASDKIIYPEGLVTGYFGGLSDAAVKRFQVKYGLAGPGNPGYGYVGPKTRAKLNELIAE